MSLPSPLLRSDIQKFRLSQDLSTNPLTSLMQNVTLELEGGSSYRYPDPETLRFAHSFLHRFSDPTNPRSLVPRLTRQADSVQDSSSDTFWWDAQRPRANI